MNTVTVLEGLIITIGNSSLARILNPSASQFPEHRVGDADAFDIRRFLWRQQLFKLLAVVVVGEPYYTHKLLLYLGRPTFSVS